MQISKGTLIILSREFPDSMSVIWARLMWDKADDCMNEKEKDLEKNITIQTRDGKTTPVSENIG